jgi:hypothetical protein
MFSVHGGIMKLFLSILFLSFSVIAQNLPADQIQGQWQSKHPIYTDTAALHMTFVFSKTKMKLTTNCVYNDGSDLSASIEVQVQYLGTDLYIQESKQSIIDDGYKYCRVALTHAKWQFYFNGVGGAVLIAPIPYGMQFQLVR